MLDRAVVKELLREELAGLKIPKNISKKVLVEAFCQYTEDDYYEWLSDNLKSFFNHGDPDWERIRKRIKKES